MITLFFLYCLRGAPKKTSNKCHLKPIGTWISNFLTYTYSTFIQIWIFALQNEVIKPTINGVLSIMKACVNAKTVRRLVFTSSAGTVNVEEHTKPVYDENCWTDVEFVRKKKMTGWVSIHFISFCLSFVIFINFPLKIPLFWFVSNFVWQTKWWMIWVILLCSDVFRVQDTCWTSRMEVCQRKQFGFHQYYTTTCGWSIYHVINATKSYNRTFSYHWYILLLPLWHCTKIMKLNYLNLYKIYLKFFRCWLNSIIWLHWPMNPIFCAMLVNATSHMV